MLSFVPSRLEKPECLHEVGQVARAKSGQRLYIGYLREPHLHSELLYANPVVMGTVVE